MKQPGRRGQPSKGSPSKGTSNTPHKYPENDPKDTIHKVMKQISHTGLKMHQYRIRENKRDASANPTIGISFEKVLEHSNLDKILKEIRTILTTIKWPIFIHTGRGLEYTQAWVQTNIGDRLKVKVEIITDDKFWNEKGVIGITDKVIHCLVYIDDQSKIEDVSESDLLDSAFNNINWK